jgi:hypothetical protein
MIESSNSTRAAMEPAAPSAQSTRWRTVSAVLAIALGLFAATRFAYANIIWNPGYYGEFGLTANPWTNFAVLRVVPGSPADQAGIRVGNRIARPDGLHERLVLSRIAPRPGERITLSVLQGDTSRAVTLQARPRTPLPAADRVLLAIHFTWLFVFVAVSLALVLLRPSAMTWGLFLFPLNLTIIFSSSDLFFSYVPTGLFLALRIVEDIIAPAGIIGFFIFGILFPANASSDWRKSLITLAPFLFIAIAAPLTYWDFVNILISPVPAVPYALDVLAVAIFAAGLIAFSARYSKANYLERRRLAWVILGLICGLAAATVGFRKQFFEIGPEQHWTAHATLLLGTIALLITYVDARGLERERIKWVVLGVVCAWVADGANHLGLSMASSNNPKWFIGLFEPLYLALPFAVAYAVIRHRVIDVRFVLSRSLTYGFIALVVALIVVAVGWLFSARLPNTHLETAAYIGTALIVGLSISATRNVVAKAVDSLLFPKWRQAQERALAIADGIIQVRSERDLYQPLTTELADAFSLASVALLERVESGGFVRVAAHGWPQGTFWHLLADDPLLLRVGEGRHVVDVEERHWHGRGAPAGVASPSLVFPIVHGKRELALLLCGAHENGTALAPDEVHAIRRLVADAAVIYGASSLGQWDRTSSLGRPIRPQRV